MGLELPPGFRFHPTDEELVVHYLRNQAASRPCPVSIIPALNLYKFDPWELPGKSGLCEGEWYFFSPRHRKYPNGARPNRATESGYWKATGTDKAIYSGSRYVGVKKALVFYRGRPPKGRKTEWIMHEYRLGDRPSKQDVGSLGVLDEWVLCRIYQKRHQRSSTEERRDDSPATEASVVSAAETSDFEEKVPGFLRSCSLAHLLESDYVSASQLFDDASFGTIDDLFDSSSGGGGRGGGDGGGVKYIGSQSGLFNLPVFIDSVFQ